MSRLTILHRKGSGFIVVEIQEDEGCPNGFNAKAVSGYFTHYHNAQAKLEIIQRRTK